jgi:anaerobic dimethyl sulfoxide reductase subunit A
MQSKHVLKGKELVMAELLKKISESSIDRRSFVAAAAVAGASASLALAGCTKPTENTVTGTDESSPTVTKLEGGEWVTFNCPNATCAYRCHNQVYVADGIMLRHGTGNVHPDSPEFPQFRPCLKGMSNRKVITGVERLKYPMKRKGWSPGGGSGVNAQLRGVDEWERLSWDEAIDIVATELLRIRDTYGNHSFLALGEQELRLGGGLLGSATLNAIGGCLTTWGQASQGGFPVVSNFMRGSYSAGAADSQDRIALSHAKTIVFWGINPAWSSSGGTAYAFLNAKKKSGAKVIFVDPFFSHTHQALGDEWIPCRPGTDGALLEALAYELISNNLHDQAFLDKYCLGFDAEHMPPDAKTNENFKDYILGTYDGTPKTPEHASAICGTPPDLIRSFAKEIGTAKPVAWKSSGAPARSYYGNRYAQLFFTVGWMLGSAGIAGAEISAGSSSPNSHLGTPGGVNMVAFGGHGYTYPKNPICTETRAESKIANRAYDPNQEYGITFTETFKAVVDGEYSVPGPNGVKKKCDIRCIVRDNQHQPATQQSGGYWAEKAFRKETVEFILVQDRFLTVDAQHADIVLPVASQLELDFCAGNPGTAEMALMGRKVIEPYFESKHDAEIFFMLCDKFGLSEEEVPRVDLKQTEFNKVLGATILKEDGTRGPLVTITKADMDKHGVTGEPVEGIIDFEEFLTNGGYQVERKDGDHFMNIFHKAFIDDPAANALKTTSGKYEIYSQGLKDYYDLCCFNDIEALPKYKASPEGHEQQVTESEFKYQLITLHHMRHAHSTFGNVKQLDEVFNNDFLMSAYDAEKNGFKKGDWVLVTSTEGGQIARRLNTIPQLMPGVVIMGQGNWRTIDQATGIDIGANINTVCKAELVGDGYQSWNSTLLKIEKYTGPALELDYKRPPVTPGL